MKINLNIIKILIFSLFFGITTIQAYTWITDQCQPFGCDGCKDIKTDIENAAEAIDERHELLEETISKKYRKVILKANIEKIDKIQTGITKSVARIRAMEHQANIDSKNLIFLLRKNKDLYTLPMGLNK